MMAGSTVIGTVQFAVFWGPTVLPSVLQPLIGVYLPYLKKVL